MDFREALIVSFNFSPRVVRASRNKFLFCILLQLCGDIAPNPGPPVIKYPCATCSKAVTSRQRGIECSRCENWSHANCVNMSIDEYNALSEDFECPWYCPSCTTDMNELAFPNCSFESKTLEDSSFVSFSTSNPTVRSLTCWCFNARSIVNKRLDFLAKISALSPDVIMITETYLDTSITDNEIFPPNYTVFRLDRNRHGGDILIAVLSAFTSIACPQYGRPSIELLWIQLHVGSYPVMFGVFYRPPSSPESYLSELQSSLYSLPQASAVFLCGDFNLPSICWNNPSMNSADNNTSLLFSMIHDLSLEQCVLTPTRGLNLLDLVFTNRPEMVSSLEVYDNLPNTDHDCVEFYLDILPPKQTSVHRLLYNYKKTDFDMYRRSLDCVPWDLAEADDIDVWWTQWKDLFFAVVNDNVPQVRWRRRRMKTWLSEATLHLVRLKRLCYRKLKKLFSPIRQAQYNHLRNKVRAATRFDFRTYVNSVTEDLYHKQKVFWSWINRIRACCNPIPPINHKDQVVTSDPTKANLFNQYFVSVFTKEDLSSLPEGPRYPTSDSFTFDHLSVSPSDVFSELSVLDTDKACGPDGICPRLLKEGATELATPLATLYNKSLSDGFLPLDWVSANITPVFKKGNKHLVSNYRPISLTCIIVKVLERIIFNKFYTLLESHQVLNDAQFGFRTKRSTTSLLLSAVDDWASHLNKRLTTHCVFLDFAKAFDSVPHQRLLLKLKAFGVHGTMLQWFSSFLTTRQQRVVINGCYSEWSPVLSGVP